MELFLEHCTAQMDKDHKWEPVRAKDHVSPEDLEQCAMCNAQRTVPLEVAGQTIRGDMIYRRRNLLIGGYDYYSTSLGIVAKIVDASTGAGELLTVLTDMQYEQEKAQRQTKEAVQVQ